MTLGLGSIAAPFHHLVRPARPPQAPVATASPTPSHGCDYYTMGVGVGQANIDRLTALFADPKLRADFVANGGEARDLDAMTADLAELRKQVGIFQTKVATLAPDNNLAELVAPVARIFPQLYGPALYQALEAQPVAVRQQFRADRDSLDMTTPAWQDQVTHTSDACRAR